MWDHVRMQKNKVGSQCMCCQPFTRKYTLFWYLLFCYTNKKKSVLGINGLQHEHFLKLGSPIIFLYLTHEI